MPARVTKAPISTNSGTTESVYFAMSRISVVTEENAAGQERIRPIPASPTAAMLNAIGTRSAISANSAAKPRAASAILASGGRQVSGVRPEGRARGENQMHQCSEQQQDGDRVLKRRDGDPELRGHVAIRKGPAGALPDQPCS